MAVLTQPSTPVHSKVLANLSPRFFAVIAEASSLANTRPSSTLLGLLGAKTTVSSANPFCRANPRRFEAMSAMTTRPYPENLATAAHRRPTAPAPITRHEAPGFAAAFRTEWMATARGSSRAPSAYERVSGNLCSSTLSVPALNLLFYSPPRAWKRRERGFTTLTCAPIWQDD